MKRAITPAELIRRLEEAVQNSSTEEEKAKREAQLAGAKAMHELWYGYRRRWFKDEKNREKIRAYNREYSRKHRGTNEMPDYLELTVVERKIMEDVDNVK